MSFWTRKDGDFSILQEGPADGSTPQRIVCYENRARESRLKEIEFQEVKCEIRGRGEILARRVMVRVEKLHFSELAELVQNLPMTASGVSLYQIGHLPYFSVVIDSYPASADKTKDLYLVLECLNNFERIEPAAVFQEMKRDVGALFPETQETYAKQVKDLYESRNFNEALSLALHCERDGEMEGLVTSLCQLCLDREDYTNFLTAISHEKDKDSIFEIASAILNKDEKSRESLKTALRLFDLCDEVAVRVKGQVFAELSGEPFNESLIDLASKLHGDGLLQVADTLFSKNQEIRKLKEIIEPAKAVGVHADSSVFRGSSPKGASSDTDPSLDGHS
ncbi:MAG: hypothetical protein EBX40_05655 [Gammaproteobacteria bacterium]|nr:hypothetical protein [Gammaproteobacteria bacterium]